MIPASRAATATPGLKEGLVHISKLDKKRTEKVEDVCNVGDEMKVKFLGFDEKGQIALLETYLSVNDFKYTHKLYLLDDYNQFADTLSFFVLYYVSYNFSQRFHMSSGSTSAKSWSFSKYNKYNPKWREIHFPNENFFGKTNLFNNSYGDK